MKLKAELLVFIFVSIFILFSCTTTKPSTSFIESDEVQKKPREAVAITTPRISKKKFSSIEPSLLQKIENARAGDLQEAIAVLKKKEPKLSKDEESLLRIAYALQAILYQEKIDESLYTDSTDLDSYAATIAAAKRGIYDFNSGTEDFFSLSLPSLVLITAPSVHNYYEEARFALEKALSLNPESFFAEYLFAILLEEGFSLDEAIPRYKNAHEKNPSYIPTILRYMKALAKIGQEKEAFQKAELILTHEDHNIDALWIAARYSFSEKKYDAAEMYISRLLQRDPNNSEFILFRAKVLMAKEEFMKASSLLDLYAKTDKTAREYLELKALLQRDWNKNPTAAASTLQEALRLYPDDLELLLIAASISAQLGQKVADFSLEELLDRILVKEPQNSEAIAIRVDEFILQEQWQDAYAANSSLYAQAKKDPHVLLNEIKICLALNKVSEAREAYDFLQVLTGENEETMLSNIRILIAEKAETSARSLIETNLGKATNTRTKSALYFERSKLASSDEARLNDLRFSLTANPRNADALFSLYNYYFQQKEYRKAQYYLKQAVSLNTNSKILLERNKELDILLAE